MIPCCIYSRQRTGVLTGRAHRRGVRLLARQRRARACGGSEFLGEGFEVRATDGGAEKHVQAGGIRDALDFFPQAIGHPVKADFQGLDNILLAGESLAFFDGKPRSVM